MYRAVTYLAQKEGFIAITGVQEEKTQKFQNEIFIHEEELLAKLKESEIKFLYNPTSGSADIYLNGKNIEKEIRSIEIANLVSHIAKITKVRSYLVDLQRYIGEQKGIVMDGRDIGTVVFPKAELKIFMTASEKIRAERRFQELKQKGDTTSFEDVLKNVQYRDFLDTTRIESPLSKASDAIEIDNSHMTFDEQVSKIIDLAKQKIK